MNVIKRGSPPHTRGTQFGNDSCSRYPRITPAYTGNTANGKNTNYYGKGSPPHTRGTLFTYQWQLENLRITPAYTGNTQAIANIQAVMEDHPRIHGEHSREQSTLSPFQGLPPHTRGTHDNLKYNKIDHRITPAYTGNTLMTCLHYRFYRDHPRIHGEHSLTSLTIYLY